MTPNERRERLHEVICRAERVGAALLELLESAKDVLDEVKRLNAERKDKPAPTFSLRYPSDRDAL